MLAFNLHGIHHKHPGLAWPDLRGAFLAEGGRFGLGSSRAVARQFRGPIAAAQCSPRRAGPDRVRPVEGGGAPRVGGAAGCGGPWVNDDQPAEQTVPFRVNAPGSTFGPL